MQPSLEAGLSRPWHRLRLPAELEARYAAQRASGGARRIRSWLLVFIAVNVLSVKVDLDLFGPEAVAVPAALTLGLLVPVTLAAILLLRRDPPPRRQTAAVTVVSLVAMGVTLNSARIAPNAHADIYLILAATIPLIVGMIAPLSFRHSLVYCGASLALYVGAVAGLDLGGAEGSGVPVLVASLILVPLKLSFSREWETKQSFLLGLRERLQADALAEANDRLAELSVTDPLTGLANRRLFGERLDGAWAAAGEVCAWVGLALVDVDHFKAFNDTAGHAAGDRCLRAVAQALRAAAPPDSLVARYGGEEFVVLLPDAGPEAARAAAAALHAAVARLALPHPGLPAGGRVAASVGVSAAHGTAQALGLRPGDLLAAADRALYAAKNAGRDRVTFSDVAGPAAVGLAA